MSDRCRSRHEVPNKEREVTEIPSLLPLARGGTKGEAPAVVPVAPSLLSLFIAHLPGAPAPLAQNRLETELGRFLTAARTAWPTLPLDLDVFVSHVAERCVERRLPPVIHAGDLYLACACAQGVAGAHEAFEHRYLGEITRAISRTRDISRAGPSAAFVDEATQRLREHLFVSPLSPQGLPKIAEYRGQAALRAWVTVAASRTALMLLRGEARRRETTGAGDQLPVEGSQELVLLRQRYAPDFAAALADAFARLSDKERMVLELHIVNRLSIDGLGELYKVGRSTAARWLVSARTKLVDETRRQLQRKLGLSDSEYDSLAAMIRSQLEVSVVRLLRHVREGDAK
jgi:RNA polymerase sigma-70 factor, ECF subfamily